MPDGTLLSLPIPSHDKPAYSDLAYKGLAYDSLLKQLNPKRSYSGCHLDPDIREGIWANAPANWQPAFGQIGPPQGQLRNQGVGEGDLFLFFGWFRQVQHGVDGTLQYVRSAPGIHAIFGYLQVGRVLCQPDDVAKYQWHPHANEARRHNKNNALYLARETLSFDENMPGCGVLDFAENRVLTMKGCPKGTWREIPALMPANIVSNRKNSAVGGGIYYQGIWQEMVLKENEESEEWAKSVLCGDGP